MLWWVPRSSNCRADLLTKYAYKVGFKSKLHQSRILQFFESSSVRSTALLCSFNESFDPNLRLGSYGYIISWRSTFSVPQNLYIACGTIKCKDSFEAETIALDFLISDIFHLLSCFDLAAHCGAGVRD